MIRARLQTGGEDSGRWNLNVEGHAAHDLCAFVSALQHSIASGLEQLAERYPDQVELVVELPDGTTLTAGEPDDGSG